MASRLGIRTRDLLLSTGKAARRLSVTPDTVLKWIKSGRLPAVRTAGGHYRIAESDLHDLVSDAGGSGRSDAGGFVYCWEYYATGNQPNDSCLDCLAYRARARRCYEMSSLAPDVGYAGAHCSTSCEDCPYFQEVAYRARRVLIVTASANLRHRLLEDSAGSRLEVEFAASEYECSSVCADFNPEYVVIDGALPKPARARLCSHLAADPRIHGVRIILAIPGDGPPGGEAERGFDRVLPRSFSLGELDDHITGLEVTPKLHA